MKKRETTGYKVLVIILYKKMQQQWIQGPWKQVAWGHDIILTVLTLSSGIGM